MPNMNRGHSRPHVNRKANLSVWRIVLIYAGFASLWILFSDRAVALFFSDAIAITLVSMVKGWLFVAVTSFFLYGLIRRLVDSLERATDSILQSQSALQATLDALPDLLFEVDRDGLIYNYHSHRSDLLAAPPEAFLGKSFANILPPDVAETCFQAMDEADRLGYSTGKIYALQLPQGTRWFELSVSPMTDAEMSAIDTAQ